MWLAVVACDMLFVWDLMFPRRINQYNMLLQALQWCCAAIQPLKTSQIGGYATQQSTDTCTDVAAPHRSCPQLKLASQSLHL